MISLLGGYLTDLAGQVYDDSGRYTLNDTHPIIPLTNPGMSAPGPDFISFANLLYEDKPESEKNNFLETLYGLALYNNWFTMPIDVKGKPVNVRFVPGHIWGERKQKGPVAPCEVMVIGKMPGLEDSRTGCNLTGPTGQIFTEVLEELGCPPDTYYNFYITNLLKFPNPSKTSNNIPKSWIKDCKPLLDMEMRLVAPKYILCLGSEAAKEVLGPQGAVNRSTGQVFDHKFPVYTNKQGDIVYHECKAMTCIHPAAVARAPDLKPQLKSSVGLFYKLMQGDNVGLKETDLEHHVVDTVEAANAILDCMYKDTKYRGAIAVDCEWEGEHPDDPGAYLRTIQLSHKPKFAVCIVLRHCGGIPTEILDDESVKHKITKLFENSTFRNVRMVGHFLRADLPWLLHYGIDLRKAFEVPDDELVGWELTCQYGGFDTGAAAHAVCETDDYKLEVLATRLTGVHRYDAQLQESKKLICKQLSIKADDLNGYGNIPNDILYPYACYDVDVTRRLFDVYNGTDENVGLLDLDDYGNNSRRAFWISMRASPACLEMELKGLQVDMCRAEALLDTFSVAKARLMQELKDKIKWPTFNYKSPFDCRELLFGAKYRGQKEKGTDKLISKAPKGAVTFKLKPIKATSKTVKKSWEDLEASGEAVNLSPATDKETLGILYHSADDDEAKYVVSTLRDIKFIGTVLQNTLRPPDLVNGQYGLDEEGNRDYDAGLLSFICKDKRIRTHIYQTLETGRYSSSRPNLQVMSKRREADYKRILGHQYLYPMRSIFVAKSGYVLIEADYTGAELAIMAWMSGDSVMIDHVRRAQLPEDHPDYYDIHSSVAVAAFRLKCAPTKQGLASINASHLRVAAKNVVFGYAYGRGAVAIARQAKEEGVIITVEEAQALIDGLVSMYRSLPIYFENCRARVCDPKFSVNCFGRYRRFRTGLDLKTRGEMERQSMNFTIQSTCADAMSRALDHLYTWPERTYDILLQIHDAVLLEVPIADVEFVHDVVLPTCMCARVPIYSSNLDGAPISTTPYHLGIDREVMTKWGIKLKKDECVALGIPERFGK